MGKKWNAAQQEAILTCGADTLVSAGAGSGKTAVLVQRIIEMICRTEPVGIDRLLVVTFTRKAAAEMKERITEQLLAKLREAPGDRNLRRQFGLLPSARISTIHSFCLDVIRENFAAAGLDPDFKIIDEQRCRLLRKKAFSMTVDDVLSDKRLSEIFDYYGFGRRGDALEELIGSLESACSSSPFPAKWLAFCASQFEEGFSEAAPYVKMLMSSARVTVEGMMSECRALHEMIIDDTSFAGYATVLAEAEQTLSLVLSKMSESYDQAREALSGFAFGAFRKAGSEADPAIKEYLKKAKEGLSDRAKALRTTFFACAGEELKAQNRAFAPVFSMLVEIYGIYERHFTALKRKHNSIDYSDIERICLGILVEEKDGKMQPTSAAKAARASIDEIFIDEYQDSNLVQEYILRAVSRECEGQRNIFMVGDVKQSIYRFRLAMPELFLSKYASYGNKPGLLERKIDLRQNYRSRAEIIEYINGLFSLIMTNNAGEIDYANGHGLEASGTFPGPDEGGRVGIYLYDRDDDGGDETELTDNVQKEALVIYRIITDMIANRPVRDERGAFRAARYSDIAVLARSVRGFAPGLRDALLSYGVPVFAEGEEGYFDQLEIKLALALLNITDNPLQDIDMIAVMRSFIGGFGLDEITGIKLLDRDAHMYDALLIAAASDSKSRALTQLICGFMEAKHMLGLREYILHVFDKTGFREYFRALPAGELRLANLRLLVSRAAEYEDTIGGDLFSFLTYISEMGMNEISPGLARTVAENEDVVRIMSVHSSKGLQFPCVILANTGRKFNRSDERGRLLTHRELGAGPEIFERARKLRYDSVIKKAIMQKTMLENISEEMRVLYVALTRAEEYLYITGGRAGVREYAEKQAFRRKPGEYEIIYSSSFLDWIIKGTRDQNLIHFADLSENRPAIAGMPENNVNSEQYELPAAVVEKLEWKYPYEGYTSQPAKITVTELKKFRYSLLSGEYEDRKESFDFEAIKPRFAEDVDLLNARERGTVYHYAMQLLDFSKTGSSGEIRAQLESFAINGFMSGSEADSIDADRIAGFFRSEPGKRSKAAVKLYKETPFNVELNDKDYMGAPPILQGIIDLFFEEDGEMVLVDYKTDFVKNDGEQLLVERYTKQLEYYSEALAVITGRPVKEKYIYSFFLGREIKL